MAKTCEICGKGTMSGHSVTHSDRKIKRVWRPNLRRVTVLEGKTPRRKFVCTRCIRSGKIQRAL